MGELLELRKNHQKLSAAQVKELMVPVIEQSRQRKNEHDQHLCEDLEKIEELTRQRDALEESLQQEKQILDHKQQELLKHIEKLKELQSEKTKFLEENQVLELKNNRIKSSKPSPHDQKILECGKRKFKLYKDLTRIRWDFPELQRNIAGYVSNKIDYIHHFSYQKDNTDTLADNLWKEIEVSTTEHSTLSSDNKEKTNIG